MIVLACGRDPGRAGLARRAVAVNLDLSLRGRLVAAGHLDDRSIDMFLTRCADPAWWTQTVAFTAVGGRVPVAGGSPSPHRCHPQYRQRTLM